MQRYGNILIKNIYYMLSYVFRNLKSISNSKISAEEFDNIHDLFAKILYLGISGQIKRGLYKEYENKHEELVALRGKINLTESLANRCFLKKKLVCEYDEYSENTYFNQILKSTCILLIKKGEIKQDNKKNLQRIMLYFANVDELNLKQIKWHQIEYHRNNSTYKILLNICYLVVNGLLQTTENGEIILNDFLDDQQMHKIYEKFILEYYRAKHNYLSPKSSFIKWDVEDDNGIEFLPNMHSDITLTQEDYDKQQKCLIIDAKFYSHSMQKRFNKESFISGNMYQIFTYVKNKEAEENIKSVKGILLYAKTEEQLVPDHDYVIAGNGISIKTLDLNKEWYLIENQLDDLLDYFE